MQYLVHGPDAYDTATDPHIVALPRQNCVGGRENTDMDPVRVCGCVSVCERVVACSSKQNIDTLVRGLTQYHKDNTALHSKGTYCHYRPVRFSRS